MGMLPGGAARPEAISDGAMSRKTCWLIGLALGLVTLALYSPAIRHDFIAYDDQQYVTENGHVQAGLTARGVVWAFGKHAGNWHPLTWLSHMLDCQLYGLKPAGHHLTNVLLHAANTLLLFWVLRRMTGALWRSAVVAALFAWHPLHVESVAWVAERKDVLSAFFFMLTLWAYLRYAEKSDVRCPMSEGSPKAEIRKAAPGIQEPAAGPKQHGPRTTDYGSLITDHRSLFYLLSLLFFALGLMSKPMLVTLPFVLLLLDYWPLRRLSFSPLHHSTALLVRLAIEKVPFFALTAVDCVVTASAQQAAMVSTAGLAISQRLAHALLAYVHYLTALVRAAQYGGVLSLRKVAAVFGGSPRGHRAGAGDGAGVAPGCAAALSGHGLALVSWACWCR